MKTIVIDESKLIEFNYTFKSITKIVGCKLVKESYTQEEVKQLLKSLCSAIDHTMFEYLQKDADWIKESLK